MLERLRFGSKAQAVDTSVRVSFANASWANNYLEDHYKTGCKEAPSEFWKAAQVLSAYGEIQEAKNRLLDVLGPKIASVFKSGKQISITGKGISIEIGAPQRFETLSAVPVSLESKSSKASVGMNCYSDGKRSFASINDTRDRLMSLFKGAIELAESKAKK